MRVVDLSHLLVSDISLYPGTPKPEFERDNTHATSGFAEMKIRLSSHHGTHLDAPFHILPEGKQLDELPLDQFIGQAVVVDCRAVPGKAITKAHLLDHTDRIRKADFVLLHTGWSKHWGTAAYLESFPALTAEAAQWLCEQQLKGIGLDVISIDPMDAAEFRIHQIVLGAGMIIIENLTNLDQPGAEPFQFMCFPLPLPEGDGSPVRAVAILS